MPQFRPGEKHETDEPLVAVEVDPGAPLPVGQHIFELVVVDDAGNESAPARAAVIIRDETLPTAVLRAPRQVEPGASFELSGRESSDIPPGQIVRYIWTLLDQV